MRREIPFGSVRREVVLIKEAVDWAHFCRDLFVEYYTRNIKGVMFSGEVEVDESMFGRRRLDCWSHRALNRLKLFPVDQRDQDTLICIIKENVLPGSTIYTDGWSGYQNHKDHGYKHFVVEHKYTFKSTCVEFDPDSGMCVTVHTNRIEGAWIHAKQHFKFINGTKLSQFESHLCAVMWRQWDRCPKPEAILSMIVEYNPLSGPPDFTTTSLLFPTWMRQH